MLKDKTVLKLTPAQQVLLRQLTDNLGNRIVEAKLARWVKMLKPTKSGLSRAKQIGCRR